MFNDIFIDQQEIENELQDMKLKSEDLNMQLGLISQKIAYIFAQIEKCKTFQDADSYFEILDKIQESLSCLLYKYNIGLPDRLLRFTRDFDNLEPIYRKKHFERIVSHQYSF